jgi:menaquinone-specific isochorismate synthase
VSLTVHWDEVTDDRPLLDLLPDLPDDERLVLVEGDEGAVGWGVAARIDVGTGPHRFLRARDALSALAGSAGEGPLAFASFTFDETEDASVMVVPRTAFVRRGGTMRRMRTDDSIAKEYGRGALRLTTNEPERDRPRYAGSTVRDERWLEAVALALDAIEDGEYTKVVLARDLHLWSRQLFDVDRLLHDLAARFPSCMTFLIDHLVGASPERLLRRDGTTVTSRVLAGTARRGEDTAEDTAIGMSLLASEKDRREHELALRSAVDALAPVCSELRSPTEPSLVRLDNVQHLGSDLSGTLAEQEDGPPHVLELVGRLHPTAAVGGAPRGPALAAIRELEGMSRGRYAGPVGWCTPDGDGEFAIALRCAEVRGDRARLFAGAGIVKGSLPEAELTETWLKLRAMTGVLGA